MPRPDERRECDGLMVGGRLWRRASPALIHRNHATQFGHCRMAHCFQCAWHLIKERQRWREVVTFNKSRSTIVMNMILT